VANILEVEQLNARGGLVAFSEWRKFHIGNKIPQTKGTAEL